MPSATSATAGSTSKEDKSKVHKVGLRGSAKQVVEFFSFAISSILFQRGVYPPEDFSPVKKYGLNMMQPADDQVAAYIKRIISQLNKWMAKSKISKLVVVITSKETGEHIERWQFDVNVFETGSSKSRSDVAQGDKENTGQRDRSLGSSSVEKSEQEITQEIQALFRQITASVTFLPVLDGNCTFNVLVYADADSEVPLEWGDSDAKEVRDAEKVMLRSFSTNNHRIDTVVSYRLAD